MLKSGHETSWGTWEGVKTVTGPKMFRLSNDTFAKLKYVTVEIENGEEIRFENKSSYPDDPPCILSDGPCVWLPVQEENDE